MLFVFKFVVLLVVQGGKVYLPTPPSGLEVPNLTKFDLSFLLAIDMLSFVLII